MVIVCCLGLSVVIIGFSIMLRIFVFSFSMNIYVFIVKYVGVNVSLFRLFVMSMLFSCVNGFVFYWFVSGFVIIMFIVNLKNVIVFNCFSFFCESLFVLLYSWFSVVKNIGSKFSLIVRFIIVL